MSSDAGFVRELRGRDGARAAQSLYRSYGGEIYGFAYARLGDERLAEQLVQDVFIRAWHDAGEFATEGGSVRAWLYAIATEAVAETERANPSHDFAATDRPLPVESALLRYQIRMAISRLTADHRQIITLVHFRRLPISEVAELTGLAPAAVKTRLHYASLNLRLALDELEVGG